MKRYIKNFISLVLFLLPNLVPQIFALENNASLQVPEEKLVEQYKKRGFLESKRDAEGKIQFKNDEGVSIWSSEHLDPQRARPNSECGKWLALDYTSQLEGDSNIVFSYKIVSCTKNYGTITGTYVNEGEESYFLVYCIHNFALHGLIPYALDLMLDRFSEDKDLAFKKFKIKIIIDGSNVSSCYLMRAFDIMMKEEEENKRPASKSIEKYFHKLSAKYAWGEYNSKFPEITLMRREKNMTWVR